MDTALGLGFRLGWVEALAPARTIASAVSNIIFLHILRRYVHNSSVGPLGSPMFRAFLLHLLLILVLGFLLLQLATFEQCFQCSAPFDFEQMFDPDLAALDDAFEKIFLPHYVDLERALGLAATIDIRMSHLAVEPNVFQ